MWADGGRAGRECVGVTGRSLDLPPEPAARASNPGRWEETRTLRWNSSRILSHFEIVLEDTGEGNSAVDPSNIIQFVASYSVTFPALIP